MGPPTESRQKHETGHMLCFSPRPPWHSQYRKEREEGQKCFVPTLLKDVALSCEWHRLVSVAWTDGIISRTVYSSSHRSERYLILHYS